MLEEPFLRIVIAVMIILAGWLTGRLLRRGRSRLLRKGAVGRLLARRLSLIATYLITITALLWLFDFPVRWPGFQASYPLPASLIQVGVVWAISFWIVKATSSLLARAGETRRITPGIQLLIGKLFKYSIWAIAFLWTLAIFGLIGAVQGLLVGIGFAGIVVGFAARDTLGNLLAGVSLMVDRPFRVGDWIHLKGRNLVGFVKEISLRSTTIVAPDNTLVNLPNRVVDGEAIVNYSAHRLRRFFLELSVSYESDLGKAVRVIRRVLEKDPATVKAGIKGQGYFAPLEIVVTGLGESGISLQAKVFIDTTLAGGLFETKGRMLKNLKESLVRAGIEIPYPRMVVFHRGGQKV